MTGGFNAPCPLQPQITQSTTSKQCLFSQAAMPEDTGMVSLAEIPVGLFPHSYYTHVD